MTRPLTLVAVALALIGSVAAASARAGGSESEERFFGSYYYVGGEEEQSRLLSTIEMLVSRLSRLVRDVARRRLRENSPVPKEVKISPAEAGVSLQLVGASEFDGNAALENGVLVKRQHSIEGTREAHFELSEDGSVLTMRVTTRSILLPTSLDYQVSFARVPEESAPNAEGTGS